MEGANELIRRFFLIKSSYIKTTIFLFILAALICSGLLLFIPGLHPLQYPTFALLFTILAYVGCGCGALVLVKYENRKLKSTDELFLQTSFSGFVIACFFTIYVISKFLKEGKSWHIAAFMLSQLITIAVATSIFVFFGMVVFYLRTRRLKNQ